MNDVVSFFKQAFKYDYWANQSALKSLAPSASERPLKIFNHILAAQEMWLARLDGRDYSMIEIFPTRSATDAEAKLRDLHREWMNFIDKQTPESMLDAYDYANTKGDKFSNTVQDVLTQLTAHGAYHRGQIALLVRESGQRPAATDFIFYARRKETKDNDDDRN